MFRSFLFTVVFLYLLAYPKDKVTAVVEKDAEPSKVSLIKVNYSIYPTYDTKIYDIVRSRGYDDTMAKLIVAQARHESGTYKSRLFRKGNNAFGLVKHRGDTLALPKLLVAEGRLAYASYRSLEESTIAVLNFLTRKKCPFNFENVTDYSKWLKKTNYYEAPLELYTAALKVHYKAVSIYNTNNNDQITNTSIRKDIRLYDALQWQRYNSLYKGRTCK